MSTLAAPDLSSFSISRHVTMSDSGDATPFEVPPQFVAAPTVSEHPEWENFFPTCSRAVFVKTPGKIRPSKQLPDYKSGDDVRVFLRDFRDIARDHMKLGYVPNTSRLFDMYAMAIMSLGWSDSNIPAFEGSVPRLICKLLHAYGGENVSLSSFNMLQALAPGHEVPYVIEVFDQHALKVLPSEASASKLAELFVSKLDTQFGFLLCQETYGSWLEPAQKALVMQNNLVRGRQLRAAAAAVQPSQTPSAPVSLPDGFTQGAQPLQPPPPPGQTTGLGHPPPHHFPQNYPTYQQQPEPMDLDVLKEQVAALDRKVDRAFSRGDTRVNNRGGGGGVYTARRDGGRAVDNMCTKCGKFGHVTRECLSHITCFNCQKPGHYARDCRSPPRNGGGPPRGGGGTYRN